MKRILFILISFIVASAIHILGLGLTQALYNHFELSQYSQFDFIINDNYYVLLDVAIYLTFIESMRYIIRKKNVLDVFLIRKSDLNGKVIIKSNPININCSILKDKHNKLPKKSKILFSSDHLDLSIQEIPSKFFEETKEGIVFFVWEALKNSSSCNFSIKVIQKPSLFDGIVTKIDISLMKKRRVFKRTVSKISDIDFSCVRK